LLNIITKRIKKLNTFEVYGILGFIPFLLIIFLIFFNKNNLSIYLDLIMFYLFIIIAFIGATHWGFALSLKKKKSSLLFFSIIPSILVSFIYILKITITLKLLIGIFFLNIIFFYEKIYLKNIFPDWYLVLRRNLNFFVTSAVLTIILLI
jgi:hypothetical protein